MRRRRFGLVAAIASVGLLVGCVPDPEPTPVDPDRLERAYELLEEYFHHEPAWATTDCIADRLARTLSDDVVGDWDDIRWPGDWSPDDDAAFVAAVNRCIPRTAAVAWMTERDYFGEALDVSEERCAYEGSLRTVGSLGQLMHLRASVSPDREFAGRMFEGWIGCIGAESVTRFFAGILYDNVDRSWGDYTYCMADDYVAAHGADATMQYIADAVRLDRDQLATVLYLEFENYYLACGGV